MRTETKEIYKCDFCNKLYQRKAAAIKHELMCSKNPDNDRPCFHCLNLDKKDAEKERGFEYGSGCPTYVSLLHCKAKEIFLYPPKVGFKKNVIEIEECNEAMPKECELFKLNTFIN